jgi:hypothetical protein
VGRALRMDEELRILDAVSGYAFPFFEQREAD